MDANFSSDNKEQFSPKGSRARHRYLVLQKPKDLSKAGPGTVRRLSNQQAYREALGLPKRPRWPKGVRPSQS